MDNNTIHITKVFDAPIEKVWDALTNPESLKQWKSPEGMTTPDAQVDLHVDGKYAITMAGEHAGPTGKVTVRGIYKQIVEPTKLVFTWQWEGQDEKTKITIELKELSDTKTEMNFRHEGFTDNESRNSHRSGWNSTFEKLETFLQM